MDSSAWAIIKAFGERPRQFIFDGPFLIYLKQQSSDVPYFAMWIETAEVLEKAEPRESQESADNEQLQSPALPGQPDG